MLLNGVSQVWAECDNLLGVVDCTGVPSDLKLSPGQSSYTTSFKKSNQMKMQELIV